MQKGIGMKEFLLIIKEILLLLKFLAAVLLTLGDLACFAVGIFCLYGGPCGKAFSSDAFIGAATGVGISAIMAVAALALCRFDKKLVLTSLMLHEVVLFLWFALMVVATIFSKAMPQIMVHTIVLLALLGIGGGIFKTAKAIKAENDK